MNYFTFFQRKGLSYTTDVLNEFVTKEYGDLCVWRRLSLEGFHEKNFTSVDVPIAPQRIRLRVQITSPGQGDVTSADVSVKFPSGPILASDPVRVNKSDAKIRPDRRLSTILM